MHCPSWAFPSPDCPGFVPILHGHVRYVASSLLAPWQYFSSRVSQYVTLDFNQKKHIKLPVGFDAIRHILAKSVLLCPSDGTLNGAPCKAWHAKVRKKVGHKRYIKTQIATAHLNSLDTTNTSKHSSKTSAWRVLLAARFAVTVFILTRKLNAHVKYFLTPYCRKRRHNLGGH